jgi:hypothetical protein
LIGFLSSSLEISICVNVSDIILSIFAVITIPKNEDIDVVTVFYYEIKYAPPISAVIDPINFAKDIIIGNKLPDLNS